MASKLAQYYNIFIIYIKIDNLNLKKINLKILKLKKLKLKDVLSEFGNEKKITSIFTLIASLQYIWLSLKKIKHSKILTYTIILSTIYVIKVLAVYSQNIWYSGSFPEPTVSQFSVIELVSKDSLSEKYLDPYIFKDDFVNKIEPISIFSQSTTFIPTRIRIKGDLMFCISLLGEILIYTRNDSDNWELQTEIIGNMPAKTVSENGLLDILIPENFEDPKINSNENKLFFVYSTDEAQYVSKSDLVFIDNKYKLDNFETIYSLEKYSSAHQIMTGFVRNNYVNIIMGDLFEKDKAQNLDYENGKIISFNYDGSDKKIIVSGIRNPYTILNTRDYGYDNFSNRFMACSNGDSKCRIWLSIINDIDRNEVIDLGWGKDGDNGNFFCNSPDILFNAPIKPERILKCFDSESESQTNFSLRVL